MARILLIDDDEPVRYSLGKLMRRAGHTVLEAPDGRGAAARIRAEQVDILVTDIIMPERDGIEVIAEVREKYPGLPIIAISGGGRVGREEYLSMAAVFGTHATLAKPIDPDTLLDLIDELLSGRRPTATEPDG